jgi:hypothetical protein
MNATETETRFQPFTTVYVEELGKILNIHAPHATIPGVLLPRRTRLDWGFRQSGGTRWIQYFLTAESGPVALISFPNAPGDGEPSLRIVDAWLERHGYHCVSHYLDGITYFER